MCKLQPDPARRPCCSTLAAVLDQSRTGMYHNAPGLTNEHVPLNDTGYLLPLPQARWGAVDGMWQDRLAG